MKKRRGRKIKKLNFYKTYSKAAKIDEARMGSTLVDPSEVGDLRGNGQPVRVLDVLKAEFLEHLAGLEVRVHNACGDVFVLLGQAL